MHNVRHYFCKSITFTDYSLPYLFDHNHIKYLNFSRIHKTLINVLTDSSQFQEGKKKRGMTWSHDLAPSSNIVTVWHSPITVNALNRKAPNFRQHALPQVMHCPVPSFQIALSPCKDLLISTCANTINNVKLSRSVLGSGHGASLREDVAAAAIRPTLQGKETSLKMWKWSKGKEKKNANKVPGNRTL